MTGNDATPGTPASTKHPHWLLDRLATCLTIWLLRMSHLHLGHVVVLVLLSCDVQAPQVGPGLKDWIQTNATTRTGWLNIPSGKGRGIGDPHNCKS